MILELYFGSGGAVLVFLLVMGPLIVGVAALVHRLVGRR